MKNYTRKNKSQSIDPWVGVCYYEYYRPAGRLSHNGLSGNIKRRPSLNGHHYKQSFKRKN